MNKKIAMIVLALILIGVGAFYFVGGGDQFQGKISKKSRSSDIIPIDKLVIDPTLFGSNIDEEGVKHFHVAFTVSAEANATDRFKSKAVLRKIRVMVNAENAPLKNFVLYPTAEQVYKSGAGLGTTMDGYYSDGYYVDIYGAYGKIVNKSVFDSGKETYQVEFDLTSNLNLISDGGYAEIPENTGRSYVIMFEEPNVGADFSLPGHVSIDLSLGSDGVDSIFGSTENGSATSGVEWSNGVKISAWVDQGVDILNLLGLTYNHLAQ